MIRSFPLGLHRVGAGEKPFLIAEMSGNHNGSLERALRIVEAAAAAGAHALKLQTYTADTMTIDVREREFVITEAGSLWKGKSLYDLYCEAHTPWDWHAPIFKRCRELGLVAFSTPFDVTAVDFLETLDAPAYKIASFENTDLALIRRAGATGKPLIVSTGLATLEEIDEAVAAAREAGCRDLVLMKCSSSYPADPADTNLAAMAFLRERCGCHVGLSDHTRGIGVAVAACALGAVAIEKHFTTSRADEGVDAAFSIEPAEMRALAEASASAAKATGRVAFGPAEHEKTSLQFRRSLYVVRDVPAGAMLDRESVRAIRPGYGLPPKHLEAVLGRRVKTGVHKGTPLDWKLLEEK